MIYFFFVALALGFVKAEKSATLELTGHAPTVHFGKLGGSDVLTLTHSPAEETLICSGTFEASDVRIAGTLTTVADLISKVGSLESDVAALQARFAEVAELRQLMQAPPPSWTCVSKAGYWASGSSTCWIHSNPLDNALSACTGKCEARDMTAQPMAFWLDPLFGAGNAEPVNGEGYKTALCEAMCPGYSLTDPSNSNSGHEAWNGIVPSCEAVESSNKICWIDDKGAMSGSWNADDSGSTLSVIDGQDRADRVDNHARLCPCNVGPVPPMPPSSPPPAPPPLSAQCAAKPGGSYWAAESSTCWIHSNPLDNALSACTGKCEAQGMLAQSITAWLDPLFGAGNAEPVNGEGYKTALCEAMCPGYSLTDPSNSNSGHEAWNGIVPSCEAVESSNKICWIDDKGAMSGSWNADDSGSTLSVIDGQDRADRVDNHARLCPCQFA